MQTLFGYLASQLADYNGFVVVKLLLLYVNINDRNDKRKQGSVFGKMNKTSTKMKVNDLSQIKIIFITASCGGSSCATSLYENLNVKAA